MPQEQLFEEAAAVPGHVASTDQFGGTGAGAMERAATLSACRTYRYALWRRWGHGDYAMFIGLNPSTADETNDDPTIRRCIAFARSWGYGALCMANLFAYRATEPAGEGWPPRAPAVPAGELEAATVGAVVTPNHEFGRNRSRHQGDHNGRHRRFLTIDPRWRCVFHSHNQRAKEKSSPGNCHHALKYLPRMDVPWMGGCSGLVGYGREILKLLLQKELVCV